LVIRQAETSAAWAGAENTTPSASAPRAAETIVFFMKSSQGLKNGTGEPVRQASPTATSPLCGWRFRIQNKHQNEMLSINKSN
jgi:hypothetical protein